jgi:hypothetical protein
MSLPVSFRDLFYNYLNINIYFGKLRETGKVKMKMK